MSTDTKSTTLFITIPHVSRLFIYEDNWTDNKVMRPVITEILKLGQFKVHYLGENPTQSFENIAANAADSALICLTIADMDLQDRSAHTIKNLFIQELCNRKNRFLFENEVVDSAKNVTSINITIRMHALRKLEMSSSQAA